MRKARSIGAYLKRAVAINLIYWVGLFLLIAGVLTLIWGHYSRYDGFSWDQFLSDFYSNISMEFISAGITIILIDRLSDYRAQGLVREQLIRQLRSKDKSLVISSAEELDFFGWLKDGSLINRQLPGVNFSEIEILNEVDLSSCNLRNADFSRCNLVKSKFDGAILIGANFTGANLALASLKSCFLTDADFSSAVLTGADFCSADLQGVNVQTAIGLEAGIFDENTIMPDGMRWRQKSNERREDN